METHVESARRDGRRTFRFQRITRRLALRHIHNPMHIEADLLRARGPGFIAEAVYVLAVVSGVEGMVARGDSFLVDQVLVCWTNDLERTKRRVSECCIESA